MCNSRVAGLLRDVIMKWGFTREERVQRHLLVQANITLELRVSDSNSQDSTVTTQHYASLIDPTMYQSRWLSRKTVYSLKRIRKIIQHCTTKTPANTITPPENVIGQ
ncbi:hypothetical protein CBL_00701 [Carabus blaptoides fortunei]